MTSKSRSFLGLSPEKIFFPSAYLMFLPGYPTTSLNLFWELVSVSSLPRPNTSLPTQSPKSWCHIHLLHFFLLILKSNCSTVLISFAEVYFKSVPFIQFPLVLLKYKFSSSFTWTFETVSLPMSSGLICHVPPHHPPHTHTCTHAASVTPLNSPLPKNL